eukprot:1153728-Pelagomonas_calceolata.AAC.7
MPTWCLLVRILFIVGWGQLRAMWSALSILPRDGQHADVEDLLNLVAVIVWNIPGGAADFFVGKLRGAVWHCVAFASYCNSLCQEAKGVSKAKLVPFAEVKKSHMATAGDQPTSRTPERMFYEELQAKIKGTDQSQESVLCAGVMRCKEGAPIIVCWH